MLDVQRLVLAETLGLAMARAAAGILDKHRGMLTGKEEPLPDLEGAGFISDNAIFTAVLDAANECLGRFDARPPEERWCDALLQLLELAGVAPPAGVAPAAGTAPAAGAPAPA